MTENPDGVFAPLALLPPLHAGHQGPQRRVADAPRGAGAARERHEGTHRRSGSTRAAAAGRAAAARRRTCDADVAVIGGGIVGITTALLLQEAGMRVVLLEAGRLGARRERLHDRQGLLPARADLRPAAIEVRRRRRADLRRGQRGGARVDRRSRRARRDRLRLPPPRAPTPTSRTGSTASSAEREAEAAIEAGPARLARRGDAAPLPRRGRRALRRPGGVPRPQVPARPRRAARRRLRGLRALPRRPGRHRRALRRQDARRQRHGRPRRARHALPVPRPRARLRARAPAAVLRDAVPHRGRAAARACSSAATRRRARSAPCRSTARSCCSSAARATRPARAATPRSATARSSAFAREHWDVRVRRVPLVLAGRHDDRRRALRRRR